MSTNNMLAKYQVASSNTSKVRQLIILYEGIINFLNKARQGMLNKDVNERHSNIKKAVNIIKSLQLALDMEGGGEVAVALDEFYDKMIIRLHSIGIKQQSVDAIEHVITQFRNVIAIWQDIEQQLSTAIQDKHPIVDRPHSNITIKI